MSLGGIIGGQLLMGIRFVVDARQMQSGANQAERALIGIKKRALEVDKATENMARNLQRSLQGIGMAATMVGAVAVKAGTMMIGGFLKPSYETAREFTDAMAMMRIVTKSSATELKTLDTLMRSSSVGTMFDPTSTAQAFTRLAAFTGSITESQKNLPTLQDFTAATMGEMDPEEAARTLSSAYMKFEKVLPNMRKAADIMIEAANVSPFEFKDIPQFIRSLRDVTITANTSMEEVFALGGAMRGVLSPADSGRMMAAFSTRLNVMSTAIQEYARKNKISFGEAMASAKLDSGTKLFTQAVSELGVEFFDANGKQLDFMHNIVKLISRFEEVKRVMGDQDYQRLVYRLMGRHASSFMGVIMDYKRGGKTASEAIQMFQKQLEESGGTAKWAREVAEAAPGGIEKKYAAAVARMKLSFGDPLMRMFLPIIEAATAFIDKVNVLLQKHPLLAKVTGILTVTLGGLLVTLGSVTVAFGAVALWVSFLIPAMSGLSAATAGATAALAGFGVAAKAVFLKAALVVGVIAILYVAYNSFLEKTGIQTESWTNKMRRAFSNLSLIIEGVMEFWSGTGHNKELFDKLDEKGLLPVVGAVLQLGYVFGQLFKGIKEGILAGLVPLGAALWLVTLPLRAIYWVYDNFYRVMANDKGWTKIEMIGKIFLWVGRIAGVYLASKLILLAATFVLVKIKALALGLSLIAAAGPMGIFLALAVALGALFTQDFFWDGAIKFFGWFGLTLNNLGESIRVLVYKAIESFKLMWGYATGKYSAEQVSAKMKKLEGYQGNKASFDEALNKAYAVDSPIVQAQASREYLLRKHGINTEGLSDKEARLGSSWVTESDVQKIRDMVGSRARYLGTADTGKQSVDAWQGAPRAGVTQTVSIDIKMDARGNNDAAAMSRELKARLRKELPGLFNDYAEMYMTQ